MHRILTQTLDISTASEAAALDVQGALSRAFAGAERRRIEGVFDRLAGQGTLRIDRLELDLGVLSGADWLDHLFDRLAEAAERAIGAEDPAPPQGSAGSVFATTGSAGRATGVARPDAGRSVLDALTAYLLLGRLPWWSDLAPARGWVAAALAELTPIGRAALAALAAHRPRAIHRLVLALPPDALAELLAPLIPALGADRLAALSELFDKVPSTRGRPSAEVLAFWSACLGAAEGAETGTATSAGALRKSLVAFLARLDRQGALPDAVARAFVARLPGDWRAVFRQACEAAGMSVARAFPEPRPSPALPGADRDALRSDRRRLSAGTLAAPAVVSSTARTGPAPDAARALKQPDLPTETEHAIPVATAGLVLFHPFLPELFTRCGYWDGKTFADPAAIHAATRLLGYIAYGDPEADEALLTLAKVLAGFDPPETVLDPDPPDAEALGKAEALIGAVLGHWSALCSRDPDFLRSQFVRRRGHLSRTDAGWMLSVEGLAQDVLLDRLPWGIGVVRLPWMTQFLTVRWRD